MHSLKRIFVFFIFLSLFTGPALLAHPIPDLPVFGSFDVNGTSSLLVEVDPRAFAEDPEAEPFLTTLAFADFNQSMRKQLLEEARKLVEDSLLIRLNGNDWHLPDLQYRFSERNTTEVPEGPVLFVEGSTELIRENQATYQIMAKETARLDLIFTNRINGTPHRRVNVLFPGEESFILPLPPLGDNWPKNLAGEASKAVASSNQVVQAYPSSDTWSTVASFFRQGFVHVLPLGLDHILFVLGLFLLSRKWKPLLYQVTCFTVAHTITLGMATLGWISVPAQVVEPIIAASIAFVALENLFFPAYHPRRLVVVFFFGLIHGLGFAGALSDLNLDPSLLILSLVGFNLGVEGGQLAVILLSLLGTYRFKDEKSYRKGIVIPGSLLIAGFGIFWTIERILNG